MSKVSGKGMWQCLPIADRLWKKVTKTDYCWLWTGATSDGYGNIAVGKLNPEYGPNKMIPVHVLSYLMHNDLFKVPDGYQVDHKCFVHECVNPDHLRLLLVKHNIQNRKGANLNSATGVRNVLWYPSRQKYRVCVTCDGKQNHGGYFKTLEDAEEAAIKLRKELFAHTDGE